MHSLTTLILFATLSVAQNGFLSGNEIDGSSSLDFQVSFSLDPGGAKTTVTLTSSLEAPSQSTGSNPQPASPASASVPPASTSTSSIFTDNSPISTSTSPAPASISPVSASIPLVSASASLVLTSASLISANTSLVSNATAAIAPPSQTFGVDVGAFSNPTNNTVSFEFRPNNVSASVGDVVIFNMLGLAHSVTQSSFDKPCQSIGVFDTDLQSNPQNRTNQTLEVFSVYDNSPLWFYCKQTHHCQSGMVFAINPKSDQQMKAFISNAIQSNVTGPSNTPNISSTAQAASSSSVSQCITGLVPSASFVSGLTSGSAAGVPAGGWNASTVQESNTPPAPTNFMGTNTPPAPTSSMGTNSTTALSSSAQQTRVPSGSRAVLREEILSFVHFFGIAAMLLF
ncbi:hypothetical protein MMC10_006996 [Thelotrema lepadinum]|nr:hypothetical protein [Thelotrema lepadinum]